MPDEMHPLRMLDLCCGAGGWACAARELPIVPVCAVDVWPPACATYRHNFRQCTVLEGDVRTGAVQKAIRERGPYDAIVGGIPCEWLSVYRNVGHGRKGEITQKERERNRGLLDACLGIVRDLAPRWWCLEDVIQIVRELPPLTPYVILDSAEYSMQKRKRAFVGNFPVPARSANSDDFRWALHERGPWRIGKRTLERRMVTSEFFSAETTRGLKANEKCPTVRGQGSRRDAEQVLADPVLPGGRRQVEWQEWARAQGFPSDFVFVGCPGDAMKMIGQAIQIDLGRAILTEIVKAARSEVDAEGATMPFERSRA